MKFDDLEFTPSSAGGVRAVAQFPNGYRASVVRGDFTYGGDRGFYELAVMDDRGICYDTPITDDVLGYLTPDDVTRLLADIEALHAAQKAGAQ